MALIEFKNYPDTTTPINATNLNNNFDYLEESSKEEIISDTLTVNNIAVASKEAKFQSIAIPQKQGYTPIAISVVDISGTMSGYMVVMPTLAGWLCVYNNTGSSTTIGISMRIVYKKV